MCMSMLVWYMRLVAWTVVVYVVVRLAAAGRRLRWVVVVATAERCQGRRRWRARVRRASWWPWQRVRACRCAARAMLLLILLVVVEAGARSRTASFPTRLRCLARHVTWPLAQPTLIGWAMLIACVSRGVGRCGWARARVRALRRSRLAPLRA